MRARGPFRAILPWPMKSATRRFSLGWARDIFALKVIFLFSRIARSRGGKSVREEWLLLFSKFIASYSIFLILRRRMAARPERRKEATPRAYHHSGSLSEREEEENKEFCLNWLLVSWPGHPTIRTGGWWVGWWAGGRGDLNLRTAFPKGALAAKKNIPPLADFLMFFCGVWGVDRG